MAGAKGAEKWKKYFQGKGDIKTTIGKKTVAVEFENPKTRVELQEGTEIVVYSKKSYEQYDKKYLIAIHGKENKKLLVSGDDVHKPIVGDCDNIKPQHFGLKGSNPLIENYTIAQVAKMVKDSLAPDKREDLHPVLKKFLLFLIDTVKNDYTSTKFKEFPIIKKNDKYIKEVGKNFGEVLAGVVVIAKPSLFPKLDIKSNDSIFFPKEENYPLADFLIVGTVNGKKKIKYYFSVKAEAGKSKNTNTVKPEDVIKLFDSNPAMKKKWQNTTEYSIISILADYGVITGPLTASAELNRSSALKSKEAILQTKNIVAALQEYKQKGKLSPKSKKVFDAAHKHVSDASKKMDYTNFFLDAINSRIYYIILKGFSDTGVPTWETIGDTTSKNQKEIKQIYLRYKDDQNRMGFQT